MIDNLKGRVIDSDVHVFGISVLLGYHKYKDNWPEGSNASASARGWRYFKLTSSLPSLHFKSLLTHVQTFYPEVKSFTKMEINLVGVNHIQFANVFPFFAIWYMLAS